MRFIVSLCLAFTAIFLLASNNINVNNSTLPKADSLPPVEKNPPNTNYKPAFAGQTRAPGVKTKTRYKVEKLAERLGRPWAITPLPGGRFILTDKSGFMAIHSADG